MEELTNTIKSKRNISMLQVNNNLVLSKPKFEIMKTMVEGDFIQNQLNYY